MRFILKSNLISDRLKNIQSRMENTYALMKKIAIIMKSSVMKNFQEQGTDKEKWKPLSKVTIQRRRKGKSKGTARILQDTGYLKMGIFPVTTENKAMVVTNVPYAPIHQFGAKKGEFGIIDVIVKEHKRRDNSGRKSILVRAHKRKMAMPWGDIPARPFMVLRQDDKQKIIDMIRGYYNGKE